MAGNNDFRWVTAIIRNMLECPGNGCRGIVDIDRGFYFRAQPVIDGNDGKPLFFQFVGDKFLPTRDAPAVEPDDRREVLFSG